MIYLSHYKTCCHFFRSVKTILTLLIRECLTQVMEEQGLYQDMLYLIVKNYYSLKSEVSGLLNELGVKTPLTKISLLGDILF